MFRNLLAGTASLATAIALIALIQQLGHLLYPVPTDVDFADPDAVREYTASLPFFAILFVAISYAVGTLVGVLVGASIGTAKPLLFAVVVGGFVLVATIANLVLIPHPLWFTIVAPLAIVASAWVGMQLAPKPAGVAEPPA